MSVPKVSSVCWDNQQVLSIKFDSKVSQISIQRLLPNDINQRDSSISYLYYDEVKYCYSNGKIDIPLIMDTPSVPFVVVIINEINNIKTHVSFLVQKTPNNNEASTLHPLNNEEGTLHPHNNEASTLHPHNNKASILGTLFGTHLNPLATTHPKKEIIYSLKNENIIAKVTRKVT
jgi:hypothetical protein